jgi:hypothetical protein
MLSRNIDASDRVDWAVTLDASVRYLKAHPIQSSSTQQCGQCGCGAVVAHHLAKVRVASSNLVIRSSEVLWITWEPTMVAWPRGEATACKAVHTGSNPVATSLHLSTIQLNICTTRRLRVSNPWAVGAAVARFPDTEEVAGSIPVPPTKKPPVKRGFFFAQAAACDTRAIAGFFSASFWP